MRAADLSVALGRRGYCLSERALTDWRVRGQLPQLDREPAASGRGSSQTWPADVAGQALCLSAALEHRHRHDWARLVAWLSGYSYPLEEMRSLWAQAEHAPWFAALAGMREPGDPPLDVADAVDALVWEARAMPQAQNLPTAYVDALIRLDVDPAFTPADLTTKDLEHFQQGISSQLRPEAGAMVAALPTDQVRAFLEFVHGYWSAPGLVKMINTYSDDELSRAHADLRVISQPYRTWLCGVVAGTAPGLDAADDWLWAGTRLAFLFGRWFLIADIAMRRHGHTDLIDATVRLVARLLADDELSALVREHMGNYAAIRDTCGADHARLAAEAQRYQATSPVAQRIGVVVESLVDEVGHLWGPLAERFFTEVAAVGGAVGYTGGTAA